MSNELIAQDDNRSVLTPSTDDLSRVVNKALLKLESILDIDTEKKTEDKEDYYDNKSKAKILSIQKDAAASILNAGLKADENRFRRENKDIIERLFDKLHNKSKIVEGHVTKKG